MEARMWYTISSLISIPFNLISIGNSLSIISIGIYGTYSLVIGITLAVIPFTLPYIIKLVKK